MTKIPQRTDEIIVNGEHAKRTGSTGTYPTLRSRRARPFDGALHGLSLTVNIAHPFATRHIASCFFNNGCYFGAARTVVGSLRFAW